MNIEIRCFKSRKILTKICIVGMVIIWSAIGISGGYASKVSAKETKNSRIENSGFSTVFYNSENGLPTSEANTIVQTSDGFIWIGGYSGLIRYDGKEFYRFDSTSGITTVVSMFVDAKDRLWVGTNDKGIALYENGKFTFYGKEQGLKSDYVKDISEDADGNILIGTTSGIAYIDGNLVMHSIEDINMDSEYICDMDADEKGNITGVTLDGDIFIIENLSIIKFYKYTELNFGKVKSVYLDDKALGVAYFGTEEDNIIKINLENSLDNYETISVKPLNCINKIYVLDSGYLWICADNGIGYMDNNGKFTEVNGAGFNNSIDDMFADYEGNLWFTSSRQGVMKIVKNRFKNISFAAGLPDMVVNSTAMYEDELYIGTDTGLFILDDNYKSIENGLTALLKNIRIRCIKTDSKGNLWLCTYGDNGLVKYDGRGNITTYNEENGLNSNRTRSMIETKSGDIVVSSSGGVNIIRNDKVVASYNADNGIENTEILTVCEGDNGIIYAGSDGGGIYVINKDEVQCINQENGLGSDVILRIKKDPSREGYWVITGNSISYMLGNQVDTISKFPYSNNFDMFFGDNDTIWILSSNGIYVVKGKDLLANSEIKYTFYNKDKGMPSNVTANSRSYLASDGTLYISGSSAVSSININQSDESMEAVKLSVPFVAIDNEVVYLKEGQKLVIPSDCKRLTIYGYVLSYTLQDPEVEYGLEGFDEGDISTYRSKMQPISYTNLKGQKYTFHLAVRNSETGEIEKEVFVQMEKEKTFWETAWFIVVIIVTISIIVILNSFIYVKIRNKALIKKQKESKVFINQVISAFAKTIDVKDKYTKGHSFRVADYASMIAKYMGYTEEQIENVHNIALLHDIGKVAIPDVILNKTESLTEEEYNIMKQHALNGYEILTEISSIPDISLGARYHHERVDGKGYPSGITGDEIPIIAKIIATADTFDAMNSTRSYRKKLSAEYIIEELKKAEGAQLDKDIVEVLIKLIEEGKIEY